MRSPADEAIAIATVGDELDREHARALLGQSSADVIDVCMEQQKRKAARTVSYESPEPTSFFASKCAFLSKGCN